MALQNMLSAESRPNVTRSTKPRYAEDPVFMRSVSSLDPSGCTGECDAPQLARSVSASYDNAFLSACGQSMALGFQQNQTDSLHLVDEPMCSALQHRQCQDQQYPASTQWPDTIPPKSLCPSTAASPPPHIGQATAAAACTAALAEILDSFGGPNIGDGWGRLALGCQSLNAASSSSSACSSSAASHQTKAQGLHYIGQHTGQAWGHLLPDQCNAPRNTSVDASDHAYHAAQLASLYNISLPIFDQPPSYRLPSDLPIWSLDIPPSNEAQLIDWCDTAIPPYMQHAHVQTLHSSQWHHNNLEVPLSLPLPLPLVSNMPDLNLQLATQPAAEAEAVATATATATATTAAVQLGIDTIDAAKPKKRKGIFDIPASSVDQCSVLSAQCSVLSAQCSVLSAQGSGLSAQC